MDTRARTSLTAAGSTTPISASVDTLWRNRSCNVCADEVGDHARTSYPATANCCANRSPMYPGPTTPTGPPKVRALVTNRS